MALATKRTGPQNQCMAAYCSCPWLCWRFLVTRSIFPAISPSLIHLAAVKLWLAQSDVDVIMEATHPLWEVVPAASVWLICFQSWSQVLCTFITWENLWEEVDELCHLPLLFCGRCVWIIRSHSVKKRPWAPAQFLSVQRAFDSRPALLRHWSGGRLFLQLHPWFKIRTSSARFLFRLSGSDLILSRAVLGRFASHGQREALHTRSVMRWGPRPGRSCHVV